MRIDVFLGGMYEGDGVAYDAVCIRDALRSWGVSSDLFSDHAHTSPACRRAAAHFAEYGSSRREPADAVLYEYSTLSPITRFLAARTEPVVLRYQNVTPAEFFEPYDTAMADFLRSARRELALLAGRAVLTLSSSRYNAGELEEAGYRNNSILGNFARVPPFSPRDRGDAPPRILFVGRVAPNKCQHHLVPVFEAWRRLFCPEGELLLVGSRDACPRYSRVVEAAARVAAHVTLAGHVPDPVSLYGDADLFVSMSEHEGFCMPIVEAMAAGMPVAAYAASAVPEILGDGGVCFSGKDIGEVAALLQSLIANPARMALLREAGRARAACFSHERLASGLRECLGAAGLGL